jgi:hypothetical protein
MTFSHQGLSYAGQPIPRFGLTSDRYDGGSSGSIWIWWRPLLSWCFSRAFGTWWVTTFGIGLRLCAPWREEWFQDDPEVHSYSIGPLGRWRLQTIPHRERPMKLPKRREAADDDTLTT